MPYLRRQCRPPPASRPRLQLGQLHADAGNAPRGSVVVADQPAREAHPRSAWRSSAMAVTSPSGWLRSRCRDRGSRTFCRLSPNCAHRPRRHEGREVGCDRWWRGEACPDAHKATRFSASARSTARLVRLRRTRWRFIVAQDDERGDPGLL